MQNEVYPISWGIYSNFHISRTNFEETRTARIIANETDDTVNQGSDAGLQSTEFYIYVQGTILITLLVLALTR